MMNQKQILLIIQNSPHGSRDPNGVKYPSVGPWPYELVLNSPNASYTHPSIIATLYYRNSEKMQKNGGVIAEKLYIRNMNN